MVKEELRSANMTTETVTHAQAQDPLIKASNGGEKDQVVCIEKVVMDEQEEETNMLRERRKSIDLVITAQEEERMRRIEEMTLVEKETMAERKKNIDLAINAVESERARRIEETTLTQQEMIQEREKSIHVAVNAQELERIRRVEESKKTQVSDELERRARTAAAIALAEEERNRRIEELEDEWRREKQERDFNRQKAHDDMEKERTRRIISDEHHEKMTNLGLTSPRSLKTASLEHDLKDVTLEKKEVKIHRRISELELPIHSNEPVKEAAALTEMRLKLAEELAAVPNFPELVGDIRLLRFLRGNDLDVERACKQYIDMLRWRKEKKVDDIRRHIVDSNLTVDKFPGYDLIMRYCPISFQYNTFDKEGNMLFIERTGYIDPQGLVAHVSKEEFLLFFRYELEYRSIHLDRMSREQGKMIRTTEVRDLQHLSLLHAYGAGLDRLKSLMVMSGKSYPETAANLILVNVPWVFYTIWNIVKMWMTAHQLKKVRFLSQDNTHQLYEVIEKANLPLFIGGSNTSIQVPETGLLGLKSYDAAIKNGATTLKIGKASSHQLPFHVTTSDKITYEFDVEEHDISFLVKFRTQGDGGAVEKTVIDSVRYSSGGTIKGSWIPPSVGTVVLVWDNSFSWTKGKNIAYKAAVVREEKR